MSEISNFNVQITFADNEIMDFEYEQFTLEEALESTFRDAKDTSDIPIKSVRIAELEI